MLLFVWDEYIFMLVKIFLTGLPGSGKSTAYRSIYQYIEDLRRGWQVQRINDYEILKAKCIADTKRKRFRWTKHKAGFNVKDFTVLDEALEDARIEIISHKTSAKKELIVIEFARNDYGHAFEKFGKDILQDAYFLFIEAKKSICLRRLKERVKQPTTPDNHYVSSSIFRSYYHKNLHYDPSDLKTVYGINERNILVIENNGREADLIAKVEQFITAILAWEEEKKSFLESDNLSNTYASIRNSSDINTAC